MVSNITAQEVKDISKIRGLLEPFLQLKNPCLESQGLS